METYVLRVLQDQVAFQCKAAAAAANGLDDALKVGNIDSTFIFLQGILVASANLSKVFWGTGGGREAERAPLRESLGVANDSPLRDPDLRNDFEHFDERVEHWFESSEHRNHLGRFVGPYNAIAGLATGDRFQHFDPESGVVTFWEHSIQLKDVLAEVQRILPLAQAEAKRPHWDNPSETLAAEPQAPPA